MSYAILDHRGLKFGYDAVKPDGRRKMPVSILRSEDRELWPYERQQLVVGGRDIQRNYTIAAWMIRKHLDFVSTFVFHPKTGDKEMDTRLAQFMTWYSQPDNCDLAGRHGLAKIIRLCEARRTVDNDVFLQKLSDGRLAAIEGDRVRMPFGGINAEDFAFYEGLGLSLADFIHGVLVGSTGRAMAYCVCKRFVQGFGFTYDRLVPAKYIEHHGYFDRFDQVRGVSPLASALNVLRDTYEGFDLALAKMKVTQLFALAFYRDATEPVEGTGYDIDFSRKAPIKLDLDPGDRAEFLESKHPSTEMQAFSNLMIAVALKALDIPFSFYDESHTNFYGSRGAYLQYENSADIKRADNRNLLDRITSWRLGLAVVDGEIELPAGWTFDRLKWEWVNKGVAWIDPMKEVSADCAAIGAGFMSTPEVAKVRGRDADDVLSEEVNFQKRRMEAYRAAGLPMPVAPGINYTEVNNEQTK